MKNTCLNWARKGYLSAETQGTDSGQRGELGNGRSGLSGDPVCGGGYDYAEVRRPYSDDGRCSGVL